MAAFPGLLFFSPSPHSRNLKKCLSSFILSDQVRQLTPFLLLNCKNIVRNSMFSSGWRLNHEMLTMTSLLLVKRLFIVSSDNCKTNSHLHYLPLYHVSLFGCSVSPFCVKYAIFSDELLHSLQVQVLALWLLLGKER